jgi:hypothetical protein
MDFTKFALALGQLAVFMIFITAVIEVIKGISAKGVWGIIKELAKTLAKNTPLSEPTLKTLNFVVALVYLRAFDYGVMLSLLNVDLSGLGRFAWWLDYIATASVVYMGADWAYQQFAALKAKAKAAANGTNGNGARPASST